MDKRKQIVYNRIVDSGIAMLKTFADAETKTFFETGKSRRLPHEIHRRAAMRLTQLGAAADIDDLRLPPSNRLEALHGERAGFWSIRINDRWRVCFTFANGDAYDVEIVDYH
jgi:proteic killer suppression protein